MGNVLGLRQPHAPATALLAVLMLHYVQPTNGSCSGPALLHKGEECSDSPARVNGLPAAPRMGATYLEQDFTGSTPLKFDRKRDDDNNAWDHYQRAGQSPTSKSCTGLNISPDPDADTLSLVATDCLPNIALLKNRVGFWRVTPYDLQDKGKLLLVHSGTCRVEVRSVSGKAGEPLPPRTYIGSDDVINVLEYLVKISGNPPTPIYPRSGYIVGCTATNQRDLGKVLTNVGIYVGDKRVSQTKDHKITRMVIDENWAWDLLREVQQEHDMSVAETAGGESERNEAKLNERIQKTDMAASSAAKGLTFTAAGGGLVNSLCHNRSIEVVSDGEGDARAVKADDCDALGLALVAAPGYWTFGPAELSNGMVVARCRACSVTIQGMPMRRRRSASWVSPSDDRTATEPRVYASTKDVMGALDDVLGGDPVRGEEQRRGVWGRGSMKCVSRQQAAGGAGIGQVESSEKVVRVVVSQGAQGDDDNGLDGVCGAVPWGRTRWDRRVRSDWVTPQGA